MKNKELNLYMRFAEDVAKLSTATKLQVGAVIVNNNNLVYGYNGTPRGWDNNCEYIDAEGKVRSLPHVIHAEENAILKCASDGVSCRGGAIFITHKPCHICAVKIIQARLDRVYYKYDYGDDIGLDHLRSSDVIVVKLD